MPTTTTASTHTTTGPAQHPRASARDPLIDLIRVLAIALVVFQHWLMPVLSVEHGQLVTGNALSTPGWWVLTWLGQVMPLVFLAGGAANALSYRTHLARTHLTRTARPGTPAGYAAAGPWLATRVHRLAVPVLPLIAVWLPLPHLLLALGLPEQPVRLAAATVAQLLWFLVVYLAAVLATPLAVAAHQRFGLAALPVLALLAGLVDGLRFAGVAGLAGFANALVVWLAVHQVGIAYADGAFTRLTWRGCAALAVGGFAATAALVTFGPYPTSMIGMPGAPVSNMAPPTLCLLTLGVGQFGLVLLGRRWLVALAGRRRVRAVLRVLAARSMTVYLWHMSALVVVGGLTVVGLGYPTPTPGGPLWLLTAPLWLAAALVVLLGLVRVFGRVEATGTARPARAGAVHVPLLVTGAVLLAVGLLGLAAFGFAPPSRPGLLALLTTGAVPWVAVLLAGLGLTRLAARHTTSPGRTDTARRPGPWWTGAPSTRHLSS
ncbi:acyltransferase family protein [Goodfellowiella coeruleoviolacea]|uniref:Acyltransferase family protein n=1 Tax=Goodfellowiella coeruleoviolacea TaxID=334858 RepID=A0AAE3GGN7_9PSEU|nr:acyltransferase family protein [Goodfellowiella coeruleoviolacea]MCP2167912.1 Acyltransferase family protein [Goodfellowiella coeruleoviolacea]